MCMHMYTGELKLSSLFGFLPTPPGVALGVGVGTYAGQLSVSLTCDRQLLQDDAGVLLEIMLEDASALCASQPADSGAATPLS